MCFSAQRALSSTLELQKPGHVYVFRVCVFFVVVNLVW
jgi:hypothetical protein